MVKKELINHQKSGVIAALKLKIMKVKIIKCSLGVGSWYAKRIGETISVIDVDKLYYKLKGSPSGYLLKKSDVNVQYRKPDKGSAQILKRAEAVLDFIDRAVEDGIIAKRTGDKLENYYAS